MKKLTGTTIIILIAIILLALPASSAPKKFGAGIIIGEPTGISLKYLNFASGIAWSVQNHLHIHVDYWIYNGLLKSPVNWFIGAGAKFRYMTKESKDRKEKDNAFGFGFRIPVGLQWFVIPEVELFAELAPGISLFPGTAFDIDGGLGARYYFF